MPVQIIPDRVCPHCGGTKWYVKYVTDKQGYSYTTYSCTVKLYATMNRYKENNPDKIKSIRKRVAQKFRVRKLADARKWSRSEKGKQYRKRRSSTLPDSYIKSMICHMMGTGMIKHKDITKEMVTQYRQQLKLERTCQQLKLRSKTTLSGQIPLEIATSIVKAIMDS